MSVDWFYNDIIANVFNLYANVVSGLTVPLGPIVWYIIIAQSKSLGRFKWFLLNHSFWSFAFMIMVILFRPIILLPAGAFYCSSGIFRETSVTSSIVTFLGALSMVVMSLGGICMSLCYRYFGLFPGKIKTICHSIPMILFFFFLHGIFLFTIVYHGGKAIRVPQTTMVEQALNFSEYLGPFIHERTFFFISEEIHLVPDILVVILLSVLTVVFIGVIILMKRELRKVLKTDIQRMLIISCIAQVLVTLIFEFLPFFFLFLSLIVKIPYSGPIMEVMEILALTHTFAEYCVTLYFVLPYRRFIRKKLEFIGNITRVKFLSKLRNTMLNFNPETTQIQTFSSEIPTNYLLKLNSIKTINRCF